MISAEIDSDGYPTAETLQAIVAREPDPDEGYGPLIEFIEPIFEHYGKIERNSGVVEIATGGWSGCEDAIGALSDNLPFWSLCWLATERGGNYRFAVGGVKSDGLPDREITIRNRGEELRLYRFDDGEVEIGVEDDARQAISMYLTREQAQQIGGFLSAHNLLNPSRSRNHDNY